MQNGPWLGVNMQQGAETIIRGVIADRRAAVRTSLGYYLSSHAGLLIEAELASGAEVVRQVVEMPPDFVVLSLPIPGPSADELVDRVRLAAPESRIIVMLDETMPDASLSRLWVAPGDVVLHATASIEL